jgi:nucleotide-binding universal stress UspA family protein
MTQKQILVALDGSKNSFRALEKSITLAKQMDAQITGIFIIQPFPTEMRLLKQTIENAIRKKTLKFMRVAKSKCEKNKVDFLDIIEYGHEDQAIVDFAKKYKFDMIVMGYRGMNPVKEAFLGSTSQYVVHVTKIPVLIVK